MEWDYSKLRGKIKEVFGTQEAYAKRIGIGTVSLSKRLNNEIEFSQDEIFESCEAMGIELNNVREYFFTLKV